MPIQNLQYKTSVETGTRRQESAGESLARLVVGSASIAKGFVDQSAEIDRQNRLIKERARVDNMNSDSMLFLDEKAKLEEYKVANKFNNANGNEQKKLLDLFYANQDESKYDTDEYKDKSSIYKNEAYGLSQKKEHLDFKNLINNETIPSIAKGHKFITPDELDMIANSFSEDGIENSKRKMLSEISKNIYNDLVNNKDEYISKNLDKEKIIADNQWLQYIRDGELGANSLQMSNVLNFIDGEIKEKRYNLVVDGQINSILNQKPVSVANAYNNAKEHKGGLTFNKFYEDLKKAGQARLGILVKGSDPVSKKLAVEMAKFLDESSIDVYENQMSSLVQLAMQRPETALENYKSISESFKAGYTYKDVGNFIDMNMALIASGADMDNLNSDDFRKASGLILEREKSGYVVASEREMNKVIEENDLDIDFDSNGDKERWKSLVNKYSRYYPREDAYIKAFEEIKLIPSIKLESNLISKDLTVDMSGTEIKTPEDVMNFIDMVGKQNYPSANIDGIKRIGDMFYFTDEDDIMIGRPMDTQEVNALYKKEKKELAEQKAVFDRENGKNKINIPNAYDLYINSINVDSTTTAPSNNSIENFKSVYIAGKIYSDEFNLAIANENIESYDYLSSLINNHLKNGKTSLSSTPITSSKFKTVRDFILDGKIDVDAVPFKDISMEEFKKAVSIYPIDVEQEFKDELSVQQKNARHVKAMLDSNGNYYGGGIMVLDNNTTGEFVTYDSIDTVPDNRKKSIITPEEYIKRFGKGLYK